jgi:two-component system cell cycle response regulator
MTNAPRLLDKLVNLTAIQDLELMEFSLLKTLVEFIKPQELSILKLDRRGKPCYRLHLKKAKYAVISGEFSISDDISAIVEVVYRTKQSFSRRIDSGCLLAAWHILQTKAQDVFLVLQTENELNKLDSHIISGLLQIYRNFYEVLSESQRDQLTGLANRKTFDEIVNRIHCLSIPTTDPVPVERRCNIDEGCESFWLAMVDVDNFKRINDLWGHLYGDEVLLLMSQLMQNHFRESDYLFRFGGEEFVIIIRACNRDQASMAFERFRSTIEKQEFPQIGHITVSIGVVRLDQNVFSSTLLDRADKALYHAKHNGRNQVVFFEELLETGLASLEEVKTGDIEFF